MKTFHVDCELRYDVLQPTVFVMNIAVPTLHDQHVCAEAISTMPPVPVEQLQARDSPNRMLRIDASPGPLEIRYMANVDVQRAMPASDAQEVPVNQLPADILPYLIATRYCESDLLFPLALREFGGLPRGVQRVEAICRWVRDNIAYQVGTSNPLSSARSTLDAGAGVCRDFAHLAIALCRALNIPARVVTGYAVYADPPPDFHAVFEAYLDGAWYVFDPTRLSPVEDLIRIGTGRDASEVAFATFFGAARLRYLSPLVELATDSEPAKALVALQQPGAGILLAA
ncbi:MAG: transglutaminase family protein [Betaproteobacteria bacterium]